jgi:hypothetical protein
MPTPEPTPTPTQSQSKYVASLLAYRRGQLAAEQKRLKDCLASVEKEIALVESLNPPPTKEPTP